MHPDATNNRVPKIQLIPKLDGYVSFEHQGREVLGWNNSLSSPRPFFYPLIGPSGKSITRMGHPAAADHSHHRSFWWGHNNIAGVNFWEETKNIGNKPQIRQDHWLHFQDGDTEASMAVQLGWYDSHNVKLIQQDLIVLIKPLLNNELWMEIQTRFTPIPVELKIPKTNFGFLGLRVAKTISARFGNGILSSSTGEITEKNIFAKPAKWMDYSGPADDKNDEGVTWFDHPINPRHPVSWHVRDDGWMSPAFCLRDQYLLERTKPLELRYGLHIHAEKLIPENANKHFDSFASSGKLSLEKIQGIYPFVIKRV